ncbi:MAG: DUF4265 domain-containing protein [Pirellulaceae bacterium]
MGSTTKDIVQATDDGHGILTIRKVIKPSGHRTLRMFDDLFDMERQNELLDQLYLPKQVTFERANKHLVALTVSPESDYLAVFDQLEDWADSGFLDFETCHSRVEGSFDDVPTLE